MVKVYGPMMSMGASGTLADTITFSRWKGRPYVRERVIPSNPKSDGQMGNRIMFAFLTQQWKSMPVPEQNAFKELAEQQSITPFNAYVQFNMNRWADFEGVSQQIPATETGTIGVSISQSFFWVGNQVHYTFVPDGNAFTVNDNWGCILHVYNETGFTPGIANARTVVKKMDPGESIIAWTPPKVEPLYCRMACFTTDGVMGPAEAEIGPVSP